MNTQHIIDIEAMPETEARRAVAQLLKSKEFECFASGHTHGVFPVGIATQTMQVALGTSARVVRLSSDDRDKQVRKGSQDGRNRYGILQNMIDTGWIVQYRDRAVSLFEHEGEWYHAAIQVTKNRDEIYLKSLRRADKSQLLRDTARGAIVQAGRGAD